MNKLTKLMLASAVIVTSGFASDIIGELAIGGVYNQCENANVENRIVVASGGIFNNEAMLTFKSGGGLNITGTFNNAKGHLELTNAAEGGFAGVITGGEITLRDTTAASFAGLQVVDITANYTYESAEKFDAPAVVGGYITVNHTEGKTNEGARTECLDKFADGSTITTFNGIAENTEGYDNRKTFPGILEDSTLNSTEYKLKTDNLETAIQGYKSKNCLEVNAAINIQFEGSNDLIFAGYDGATSVVFAGDNSLYAGVASFAGGITRVHANGANTLPKKLASNMSGITVEITGENTIDNDVAEIFIDSVQINSEAKLIVAAGTTLTVGGAQPS